MPDYTAFYTAMAWDKFNNEKEKANIKEEKDMSVLYKNYKACEESIPTQDPPVCEEPIKNKKSPTIKELLDEQSSIVKDIRIYVDQIADNIALFCAEREDNNKIEVLDLTTAIASNNETLYLIRAKLSDLSDKLG